jgi:2-keto-3-deoxy-L-fuconate dehydrogenase
MKTVLITGGSRGIGLGCVELFYKQGYSILNLDIIKPEVDRGLFIQVDLSKVVNIVDAFEKIAKETKTIDVLVSNSGIHYSASIENTSEEEFDRVHDVNFKSAFFVIKEVLKFMKKTGGRIITIGSDQVFIAKPTSAIYGATKSAIGQLTKSIALDYSKYNIIANCICAGTIETPLYWEAIDKHSKNKDIELQKIHEDEGEMQLLGRIGKVEEVASLAFYLANEAGDFLQGAMIPIDGGYTAQ